MRMVKWMWWHCHRHIIRNSSHGVLRPSMLTLGHTILNLHDWETFCLFETWRPEWGANPRSPTFQAGSFNDCARVPLVACSTQRVNPETGVWRWVTTLRTTVFAQKTLQIHSVVIFAIPAKIRRSSNFGLTVYDAAPTLHKHWVNVLRLLR